jgi:hypothetical protein
MAIRDALWACPFCREIDAIRPGKNAEVCAHCGALFRVGSRATITAGPPGVPPETRSVTEWESLLPALDDAADSAPGPCNALLRKATAAKPVQFREGLLGWAERFGATAPVTIELEDEWLRLRTASGREETWDLAAVTAVQPSSTFSRSTASRRSGHSPP